MPRVLVLLAALLSTTTPRELAAQVGCDEPSTTASARAPDLTDTPLLFQQNGVTFYGRPPGGTPLRPAEVVIRNSNRYPVEVSYTLQLEIRGDSLPRSVAVNRHCVQIPARQYATTSDTVSTPAQAIRIRNLTIGDVTPSRTPPALARSTPPPASVQTLSPGT
jgi:hypothetical protein